MVLDPTTAAVLLVAALASAFMAWVIGAGSSGATPFAPAVGANAISIMRAALVVGVLGLFGAVLQGGNVTAAVGRGLIDGVSLPAAGVIVALATAATLMAVGISTGYPIATAFTVTGAIVGVGLALGGDPAWGKYAEIGAVWVLTPVVGGGVAYGLASVLPRDDVPEAASVPALAGLVGLVVANVRLGVLGPGGTGRSIAAAVADLTAAQSSLAAAVLPFDAPSFAARVAVSLAVALGLAWLVRLDVRRDRRRGVNRFLLALGSLVAFSAGGSQVGLAVGPLLPLLDGLTVPTWAILLGGGTGLLVGSWTGAPRMIKSLSQDYSTLGPRRSISALVPSFLIAQAAVLLGVPVSFNAIVVSAIAGSGAAVSKGRASGISREKVLGTAGAWAGSFVLSLGIGYGVFALRSLV